ncbi:hypothetical protein B0H14DRAFT_2577390 [Mycena olivaceomarginata]|nr:hypothetical protein B0H14DRAFT_2577390 [Mycena olivaceomarginata]
MACDMSDKITEHSHSLLLDASMMALDTNTEKIAAYDLRPEEFKVKRRQDLRRAGDWLADPAVTYEDALSLLQQLPPVRPGEGGTATKSMSEKERTLRPLRKVTSQADWLDNCIPRHHHLFKAAVPEDDKPDIYQFLVTDHWKPTKAETTENATDLFHVNFIVEPATRIVASIQREPRLQAGFARMRSGTKTDLRVYTESFVGHHLGHN